MNGRENAVYEKRRNCQGTSRHSVGSFPSVLYSSTRLNLAGYRGTAGINKRFSGGVGEHGYVVPWGTNELS